MSIFKKKEEYVSCEDCKCLLRKNDAQFVEDVGVENIFLYRTPIIKWNKYYCRTHEKPYDAFRLTSEGTRYYKKLVEVDENGKFIK